MSIPEYILAGDTISWTRLMRAAPVHMSGVAQTISPERTGRFGAVPLAVVGMLAMASGSEPTTKVRQGSVRISIFIRKNPPSLWRATYHKKE